MFFLVLLAPMLLTIVIVLLGASEGDTVPTVAVFGGGISGIVCGAMLGRRFGRTTGLKVVLGIVFALVFSVVCIGMSCFGCLAGGYNLEF